MMVDAVQSYLNLANVVSRAARAQAVAVARTVLAQSGLEEAAADANERATQLVDEAREARRANRELVENLVAAEVTKAASRFGFVRDEDLDEIREEIAELRVQLKKAQATSTGKRSPARKVATPGAAKDPSVTVPPARKAAIRRTAAKKAEAASSEDAVAGQTPDAGA